MLRLAVEGYSKPQCTTSDVKVCVGIICHVFDAQNSGNLLGVVDSQVGGDPRAVHAKLKLTSGTQLGGTAMLGTTPTSTVLGGTANIQTAPNLVPSTQTQLGGTASLGASAVGEFGTRSLPTAEIVRR